MIDSNRILLAAALPLIGGCPSPTPLIDIDTASRSRAALSTLSRANDEFREGRYEAAADTYAKTLEVLPSPSRAAGASRLMGFQDSASYVRAVAGVETNLAMSLFRSRRLNKALLHAERAVDLAPASFRLQANLGAIQFALRRDADAVRSFERAIESGEADTKTYLDLGLATARVRDFERAEWAFARVLAKPVDDVAGWGHLLVAERELGRIAYEAGRDAEAERRLRAVLARASGEVEARHLLALVLTRRGALREAQAERERLAADRDALDDIRRILAAQAGAVRAQQLVADSYRALGLYHLADVHYRQLLARQPDDGKVRWALIDLRVRIRDGSEENRGGNHELDDAEEVRDHGGGGGAARTGGRRGGGSPHHR